MKMPFAILLARCAAAISASAQGSFVIDSSIPGGSNPGPIASTGGLVYLAPANSPGFLDTTVDINLDVLWGTTAATATTKLNIDPLGLNTGVYAGSGNWIASQATGTLDITGYGTGALLDNNGNQYFPPGAPAGSTIWLVLQGWTGSSPTIGTAQDGDFVGQTGPFAITLAANNSPMQPDVHTMSSLVLFQGPEPSIPALSALATLPMTSTFG